MGVLLNFISLVSEYISLLVIVVLPEIVQAYILNNFYILRIIAATCYIFLYVFSKRLKGSENSPFEHFYSTHWILYFLILGLFADYNLANLYEQFAPQNLPEVIVIILFLLFFLYNLIYMSTTAKALEVKKRLEKTELELLHANSMVRITNDLRGFRHDFANYVSSINGFVLEKDLPGLEAYMQKLSVQVVTSQTVEIAAAVKEIPALYGILLEKIFRAEIKRVHLNVCILANEIDLKHCSDLDYSRMVGILLDNALEAAEESTRRTIEFSIRAKNGKPLETMIINSCNKEIDIDRIFEQGYSTKDNPSGEGLHQIRLIQEKYQNTGNAIDIDTTFRNGFFTQVLKI